jgi:hypothetical protein
MSNVYVLLLGIKLHKIIPFNDFSMLSLHMKHEKLANIVINLIYDENTAHIDQAIQDIWELQHKHI